MLASYRRVIHFFGALLNEKKGKTNSAKYFGCERHAWFDYIIICTYETWCVYIYIIQLLSGWMDSALFAEWFNKFADLVKDRPLLLILDGHLTHVSISTGMYLDRGTYASRSRYAYPNRGTLYNELLFGKQKYRDGSIIFFDQENLGWTKGSDRLSYDFYRVVCQQNMVAKSMCFWVVFLWLIACELDRYNIEIDSFKT